MLKIETCYVIVSVEQVGSLMSAEAERGGTAMKIEKIDENQILWSLDREELDQNEISIVDFLTGTPRVREMFRQAIRQAERDLSFQAEGYMLNCRLREFNEEKITFTITKKEMIPETPYLVGEFGSLDEVIGVSGLLSEEMGLKNTLYKFEGSYLLLMNPEREDEKQLAWCTVNLSEFTSIEAISGTQRAFLEEHGDCIIRNEALQRLREIA